MKKNSAILILAQFALLFVAASCATTYTASYSLSLSPMPGKVDARGSDGRVAEVELGGEASGNLVYSDSIIDVTWGFGRYFELFLTNMTDHTIRVLWDGAAVVGPEGRAEPLVHGDVAIADRFAEQKPSVVPPRASIYDVAMIPSSVYYDDSSREWKTEPVLPTEFGTRRKLLETAPMMTGLELSVLLPVECEGVVYEYMFPFTVDGFTEGPVIHSGLYSSNDGSRKR